MKNQKICIVCGKAFACPPSDKTVTCSPECRSKYASMRKRGKSFSAETRAKISASAKGRDMSGIQEAATTAALKSPKSGPFETNVNAKSWRLISPEGKEYRCRNLNLWVRSHTELFGVESTKDNCARIRAGLQQAKSGKRASTYKGWQVELDE